MATVNLGEAVGSGGQLDITNYIVVRYTAGGKEVRMDEIENAAGALVALLVYQKIPLIELELQCKSGAAPLTDFPVGAMCTASGLTDYFVVSAPITYTKGIPTVTVSLRGVFLGA